MAVQALCLLDSSSFRPQSQHLTGATMCPVRIALFSTFEGSLQGAYAVPDP